MLQRNSHEWRCSTLGQVRGRPCAPLTFPCGLLLALPPRSSWSHTSAQNVCLMTPGGWVLPRLPSADRMLRELWACPALARTTQLPALSANGRHVSACRRAMQSCQMPH